MRGLLHLATVEVPEFGFAVELRHSARQVSLLDLLQEVSVPLLHLRSVVIGQANPFGSVAFQALHEELQLRAHLDELLVARLNDEIVETKLRLCDVSRIAIH